MAFYKKYSWLLPMFLFTAALLAGRMIHTRSHMFLFIPWNLFLALVPLYFSYKLHEVTGKMKAIACFIVWLLFFPNAMYIITDLFHLKKMNRIPEWYDLLILFSAAITGVIVGYLSLYNVERYIVRYIYNADTKTPATKRKALYLQLVVAVIFLLCGYGIYLGRYLRWNSWDIIGDPFSLAEDIAQDIFHPFRNKECWLLTSIFGIWLYLMYRFFKRLQQSASF